MRKQVSTIKTLMKYLGARKYWILVSLVLALGAVGLSLYIPVLTGQAVDLAIEKGKVDLSGIGAILVKIGVCACALALGGAAGVRLYAVLGLCLGALVYSCGLRAAALWLFHFCAGRKKKRGRRIPSEQESGREES